MNSSETLDQQKLRANDTPRKPVSKLWRTMERMLATVQILLGLFLFCWLINTYYFASTVWSKMRGTEIADEFIPILVKANPFILLTLFITLCGVLFWMRKNTGWLGTLLTMGLSILMCFVLYYTDVHETHSQIIEQNGITKRFDNSVYNEWYLFAALIGGLLFMIVISTNIRSRYKINRRHWTWIIATLGILTLDWVLMWYV